VEIKIPWAAVKGRDDKMNVRLPPQVGDRWKLNVVRVDKPSDKPASASSWNRISYQDFHGLDRMLTAVFADNTGAIVATQDTAGSGATVARASGSGAGSGSAATPVPPTGQGSGSAAPTRQVPPGGATSGSGTVAPKPGVGSGSSAKEIGSNP